MTPAERAVIDAARAIAPVARSALNSGKIVRHDKAEETRFGWDIPPVELDKLMAATDALEIALRALPRPLSERLAELRPGAVVETGHFGDPMHPVVIANDRGAERLWVRLHSEFEKIIRYSAVTRIISNPEADRG
jgi:hypothetical protein